MTRARAEYFSAPFMTVDDDLEREFESCALPCSTLAFRVAFSVLRQHQDAEDVAQEAFVRAHRNFRKRNRESFQAWMVRTTWRLALDHRRGEQRRSARQNAHALSNFRIPVDMAASAGLTAALWEAIDALLKKLRITIVLSAIKKDLTSPMWRGCWICQKARWKSRLYHARRQLQERLQWTR